jgi:hypothetical protein
VTAALLRFQLVSPDTMPYKVFHQVLLKGEYMQKPKRLVCFSAVLLLVSSLATQLFPASIQVKAGDYPSLAEKEVVDVD